MAEGHSDQGTDRAAASDDVTEERAVVELAYRPRSPDTLAGLRVRERVKWTGLLLRSGFLLLWVGQWLVLTVGRGAIDLVSTVLVVFVVLVVWGYPRAQAAHVQRLVGWQGEYRVTVSPAGVTCRTDHSTLIQEWPVFRGYRETAGHFVLLSRDPGIMYLSVLPKRGVRETGDSERLRALLDLHIPRV